MSDQGETKSAIVSGGSAGLGLAITRRLLREGYRVTVLGRDATRLAEAKSGLIEQGIASEQIHIVATDATSEADVGEAVASHLETLGPLDVLVNVVGRSDRGLIASLQADKLRELIEANVISTLVCSQAGLPSLKQQRGVIVNIGSLASRVAPGYLGGYVIAKHALAGLTRQMRMECLADGVHVGLICPGPIADESRQTDNRYGVDETTGVPASAAKPGGGAKVRSLTGDQVAGAVMQMIDHRTIEIVLPSKTRLLMAINAIWPSLADRILAKKMGQSDETGFR